MLFKSVEWYQFADARSTLKLKELGACRTIGSLGIMFDVFRRRTKDVRGKTVALYGVISLRSQIVLLHTEVKVVLSM
jgi:hypothetical protein